MGKYVFSALHSFRLSAKTVYRAVAEPGEKVGLHIHPHLLRHTFAHTLLDHSKDIRLVSQALGHSDVRTTMIYTEREDEQVGEAIEAAAKSSFAIRLPQHPQ